MALGFEWLGLHFLLPGLCLSSSSGRCLQSLFLPVWSGCCESETDLGCAGRSALLYFRMLKFHSVVWTENFTSHITVGLAPPWACAKVLRSFQRLSKGEASSVTSQGLTLVNAEIHRLSSLSGPFRISVEHQKCS